PVGLARLGKVGAVEADGARGDPAAGAGIAHGGEPDRRLAGARLADQPQHLAAAQRQVDALDDLVPGLLALALDPQTADLQQRRAGGVVASGGGASARVHSLSPLVLCRNQSTT